MRVHLTNVAGMGAVQLVTSLLPAIEEIAEVSTIYLPSRGPLAAYDSVSGAKLVRYERRLPNAVSRFVESMRRGVFEGEGTLLVLGDIPLRVRNQDVLVHTLHLVGADETHSPADRVKYGIARQIFGANERFVDRFLTQSPVMRDALEDRFPNVRGRVELAPNPPPQWLNGFPKRSGRVGTGPLRLFYPAAGYPHKNHAILHRLGSGWAVESVTITLQPRGDEPSWLRAVGPLPSDRIKEQYQQADGLLFLSRAESLPLPVLEAMTIGLPIVIADLPYARSLCGDGAIYFTYDDPDAVVAATAELADRLARGWWPDWTRQLAWLPKSWPEVARMMVR